MKQKGLVFFSSFFAPTGRRDVATGGAARPRSGPMRNPWKADEGKGSPALLFPFSPRRGEGDSRSDERTPRPGTYTQILLHVVFSTKHREQWIKSEVAERLYPYIGGIVRAGKGVLYDIGGVEDHVHMYLRWRPDESVSALMRTVKARSSKWVHDTFPALGSFAWQEG